MHCGNDTVDSPEHTLRICPAWNQDRETLQSAMGQDLELSSIVRVICESNEHWRVFAVFCQNVMSAKSRLKNERVDDLST